MNVRILKGAAARDARPHDDGSVRRIASAQWEARRAADALLAAAHSETQAIVARAQTEAQRIREAARAEGREAGHAEALALLVAARAEVAARADRTTALVVAATRAVAERAIGSAIAVDDAALATWAKGAIRSLAGARRIQLRVSPASASRLVAKVEQIAPSAATAIEIVADPTVADGILVAASELGQIRLDVVTQVAVFVDAIGEMVGQAVARDA